MRCNLQGINASGDPIAGLPEACENMQYTFNSGYKQSASVSVPGRIKRGIGHASSGRVMLVFCILDGAAHTVGGTLKIEEGTSESIKFNEHKDAEGNVTATTLYAYYDGSKTHAALLYELE